MQRPQLCRALGLSKIWLLCRKTAKIDEQIQHMSAKYGCLWARPRSGCILGCSIRFLDHIIVQQDQADALPLRTQELQKSQAHRMPRHACLGWRHAAVAAPCSPGARRIQPQSVAASWVAVVKAQHPSRCTAPAPHAPPPGRCPGLRLAGSAPHRSNKPWWELVKVHLTIMKRPGCSGLLSRSQQCAKIHNVGPTSVRFAIARRCLLCALTTHGCTIIIVLFYNPVC